MDEGQFERHVEFILKQQAAFDARLEAMREQQAAQAAAQATEQAARNEVVDSRFLVLTDVLLRLADESKKHEGQIGSLFEAMERLATAGRETDERLNAAILMFERWMNGNPPPPRPS